MCGVLDMVKHLFSDTVESMPKLKARVTDVDFKGVSVHSVNCIAKVNVSNPYCISIPLGQMCYVLKSSGREIATGTIYDTGSLKGNGDTLLYVSIDVLYSALVSLVEDITADWDIDYELDVTLVIDLPLVCDINIPVAKTGVVKLPSLADLFKKHK